MAPVMENHGTRVAKVFRVRTFPNIHLITFKHKSENWNVCSFPQSHTFLYSKIYSNIIPHQFYRKPFPTLRPSLSFIKAGIALRWGLPRQIWGSTLSSNLADFGVDGTCREGEPIIRWPNQTKPNQRSQLGDERSRTIETKMMVMVMMQMIIGGVKRQLCGG